ncbi:GspE/PulE family protein [Hydrogenimonas thermophila]|uniref:General secretion pathway protein E n=1 Tax=Hydrogenimonas thermophila TaxID=223786 RepID=A0A1I5M680_9BACT|nr:GspE/PulE family protein [Hydrogenimonas thermophila]SFP05035.1 general secretion pathway protein E [Hydrogenimonas thermophila]
MLKIEPYHDISLEPIDAEGIDIDLAIKHYALPTKINDEKVIAVNSRYLSQAINFIDVLNIKLQPKFIDEESFDKLYNRYLELRTDRAIESFQEESQDEIEEEELSLTEFLKTSSDILNAEESAPIIKFVNSLFYQAIKKRASDIHIEIHEHKGSVRFRIDGTLVNHVDLDKSVTNLIISRIKVISNLDISEKRIPQDGRTQVIIAKRTLDIRVSVLPTYHGERVVMRILMESESIPHLPELGFPPDIVEGLESLLRYTYGIILVTGPTGSGKSTTLHSFLQEVATPEKNIITIEDPVEYKADNINQIQANPAVGLTFAAGLRSILRQDPDVVMIGEIRDAETAKIAIQAALTGHLVFSTLHTNNATSAPLRLTEMGVEPFLVSSALLGVLAQRLVKQLCPHCKKEDTLAESYAKAYDLPSGAKIFTAEGCPHCNYTGYVGRKAIAELFMLDNDAKHALKEAKDDTDLRAYMKNRGIPTLSDYLKTMLLQGETSLAEAVRIGMNI